MQKAATDNTLGRHPRSRRIAAGQRGSAIVEFAIVALLFFSLVFAALDFGFAFTIRENMNHAAQEGLRAAIVDPGGPDSQAKTAITKARSILVGVVGTAHSQPQGQDSVPAGVTLPAGSCNTDVPGVTSGGLDICTDESAGAFPLCSDGIGHCMTIWVIYDYVDNSFVNMPLVDALLPGHLRIHITERMTA